MSDKTPIPKADQSAKKKWESEGGSIKPKPAPPKPVPPKTGEPTRQTELPND